MSRDIDSRDHHVASALGALAGLGREELERLIEPRSVLETEYRQGGLSRADLAAHLAAELADAALQRLQGHR